MTSLASKKLASFLSVYVKGGLDPSSLSLSFFKGEGVLENIHLDETKLQSLLPLPPRLRVRSAVVNTVRIKVPWSRLSEDPVIISLDAVDIVCCEVEDGSEANQDQQKQQNQAVAVKRGLMERVVDGIRVEMNSVKLTIRTMGQTSSNNTNHYHTLLVDLEGVVFRMTDRDFTANNLKKCRYVDLNGDAILHRELAMAAVTVSAYAPGSSEMVRFCTRVPVKARFVLRYRGDTTAVRHHRTDLIVDDLKMALDGMGWATLIGVVEGIVGCLQRHKAALATLAAREAEAAEKEAQVGKLTTRDLQQQALVAAAAAGAAAAASNPPPNPNPNPNPPNPPKMLSRLKNLLRKAPTPTPTSPSPAPSTPPPEEQQLDEAEVEAATLANDDDRDAEELSREFGDAEHAELLADMRALRESSLNFAFGRASLELLERDVAFGLVAWEGLSGMWNPWSAGESVMSMQVRSAVVRDLTPTAPGAFPEFRLLLGATTTTTSSSLLKVKMLTRLGAKRSLLPRREIEITASPLEVVAEPLAWGRIAGFFQRAPWGALSRSAQQGVEAVVADVINDAVLYKIKAADTALVLPPQGGSSAMMRLKVGQLTASGEPSSDETFNSRFRTGLFDDSSNNSSSSYSRSSLVASLQDLSLSTSTFAAPKDDWAERGVETPTGVIVTPVSATMEAVLVDEDTPGIKISLHVSQLKATLLERQYEFLRDILDRQPLPTTAQNKPPPPPPQQQQQQLVPLSSSQAEEDPLDPPVFLSLKVSSDRGTLVFAQDNYFGSPAAVDEVVAEVEFVLLQMALDKRGPKVVSRLAMSTFSALCPRYAGHPHHSLLLPLATKTNSHLNNLTLRYESHSEEPLSSTSTTVSSSSSPEFFAGPGGEEFAFAPSAVVPAHKVLVVRLEGMRVSLIHSTLQRLFAFFAGRPRATSSLLQGLLKSKLREIRASHVDVQAELVGCEVVAVRDPREVDCAPVVVPSVSIRRCKLADGTAVTDLAVRSALFSCTMASGEASPLCEPIDFSVTIKDSAEVSRTYLSAQTLDISLSHRQLVLLLDIVDTLLEAHDESKNQRQRQQQEAAAEASPVAVVLEACTSGKQPPQGFFPFYPVDARSGRVSSFFRASVGRATMRFLSSSAPSDNSFDNNNCFAIVVADTVSYSVAKAQLLTQSRFCIHELVVEDLAPGPHLFRTVLCAKPESTASGSTATALWARDDNSGGGGGSSSSRGDAGPPMLSVTFEKWRHHTMDVQIPLTSLVTELTPIVVVYVPSIVDRFTGFFTLPRGGQSHLKSRYEVVTKELRDLLAEGVDHHELHSKKDMRLFKLVVDSPTVLLPSTTLSSSSSNAFFNTLQIDLSQVFISNDNLNAFSLSIPRTDYFLSRAKATMAVLDPAKRALTQLRHIVNPVDVKLTILARDRAAGRYIHYALEVGEVRVRIPVERYREVVEILTGYLTKKKQQQQQLQLQEQETEVPPEVPLVSTSRLVDLSLHSLDVVLLSDYVLEHELFYVYLKKWDLTAWLYPDWFEVSTTLRVEVMVNNPNFMIPEPFVEPLHLCLEARNSATSTEVEVSTANPAKVHVTKDLLRHLLRIGKSLRGRTGDGGHASSSSSSSSDDDIYSPYRYLLRNRTGVDLYYCQDQASEARVLAPADGSAPYSFGNPYLPKSLRIGLAEAAEFSKAFALDNPGVVHVLAATAAHGAGQFDAAPQRELIVNIYPEGFKRVAEILPAHVLINQTDCPLEMRRVHPPGVYECAGNSQCPLYHSLQWTDARYQVRFGAEWEWSAPFALRTSRRDEGTLEVLVASRALAEQRVVFLAQVRDEATHVEQVVITAPLVIENLTVFPLHYCFPSTVSGAVLRGGVVPPSSRKLFYSRVDAALSVAFALHEYRVWSPFVRVEAISKKMTKVVLHRQAREALHRAGPLPLRLPDGDYQKKESLSVNVFAEPRLAGARTLCVSLRFLFVNNSDLPLFVRQRDSLEAMRLDPGARAPFSWGPSGQQQVTVNVASGVWSAPINIFLKSINVLSIDMPEQRLQCQLLMEVRPIDAYSRVVTWSSKYHFSNELDRPVRVLIGLHCVDIPANASANSAVVSDTLVVTLPGGGWAQEPFVADEAHSTTVMLRRQALAEDDLERRDECAVDVTVKTEDKGAVHVYFTRSLFPPFTIHNSTAFDVEVAQAGLEWCPQRLPAGAGANWYWTTHRERTRLKVRYVPRGEAGAGVGAAAAASPAAAGDPDFRVPGPWSDAFSIDALSASGAPVPMDMAAATRAAASPAAASLRALEFSVHARGRTKLVVLGTSAAHHQLAFGHSLQRRRQRHQVRLKLRVPVLEISSLDEQLKSPVVVAYVHQLSAEYLRQAGPGEFLYLTIRDVQVDSMVLTTEYPVLLAADKRKLFAFEANMVEFLMERSRHEDFTFTEFVGVRVLPVLVSVEDEIVRALGDLVEPLVAPSGGAGSEAGPAGGRTLGCAAEDRARYTAFRLDAAQDPLLRGGLSITHSERQKVYVDSLLVYPLEIELAVGDNTFGFPVIREGTRLQLGQFSRSNLFESERALASQLARSYLSLGWLEVYKIIGSLDALGSPLVFATRIAEGISAVLLAPWADLILDDTPGSFLLTMGRGVLVLLKNVTDAVFLTVAKVFGALALLAVRLSLDVPFYKVKLRVRRDHPGNLVTGVYQGLRELARGVAYGFIGIWSLPAAAYREDPLPWPVLLALVMGLLGLPLKIVGGVFEVVSKVLEGLTNTTNTSLTAVDAAPLQRRREPQAEEHGLRDALLLVHSHLAARGDRVLDHEHVHVVTSKLRRRPRILALSSTGLWLFNPSKLHDSDPPEPAHAPYHVLAEVLISRSNELDFSIAMTRVVHSKEAWRLVSGARSTCIAKIVEQFAAHTDGRICKVGTE
jgi:hypothetical protein